MKRACQKIWDGAYRSASPGAAEKVGGRCGGGRRSRARMGQGASRRWGVQRVRLGVLGLLALVGCTSQDVWFCPEDGCADRLIEEIQAGTTSIHVAIAYFNHTDIAKALVDAHKRGVEVRVVGEKDENHPASSDSGSGINYEAVKLLVDAGVPYRDDGNPDLMHNKFTIVDGRTVLTGSFNYTNSADLRNNENLVMLTSPTMADAFEAEFEKLWDAGAP